MHGVVPRLALLSNQIFLAGSSYTGVAVLLSDGDPLDLEWEHVRYNASVWLGGAWRWERKEEGARARGGGGKGGVVGQDHINGV